MQMVLFYLLRSCHVRFLFHPNSVEIYVYFFHSTENVHFPEIVLHRGWCQQLFTEDILPMKSLDREF